MMSQRGKRMLTRSRLLYGLLLVLAAALTLLKIPVASSQGLTVVAARVRGDLPVNDPASELWQQAMTVNVPLSAQNVTRPMLLNPSIRSVNVRALHNGVQLAVLVEWADATQNSTMLRTEDFRDAVALQFPLVEGQPYICMGQQGGNVNVWHWKSDWQADLAAQQDVLTQYPDMHVDYYPFPDAAGADVMYLPARAAGNLVASAERLSPVEDLTAGGFGTLLSQPLEQQNVQGHGVWVDGQWSTIFSRRLSSSESTDISFAMDRIYSVAFAVWDGAQAERNGQKSTSQWVSLRLDAQAAPSAPGSNAPPVVREPQARAATSTGMEGFAVVVLGILAANVACLAPIGAMLLLVAVTGRRSS
jgi:DMSO reductase family type II enzyme heme b subunit